MVSHKNCSNCNNLFNVNSFPPRQTLAEGRPSVGIQMETSGCDLDVSEEAVGGDDGCTICCGNEFQKENKDMEVKRK